MGTRSLTIVHDESGDKIITMYRQMDGYPSGHGLELAKFLDGLIVINGISDYSLKSANGMGCLAAQTVAHFKDGIGNIYLYANENNQDYYWQEYEYHLYSTIENGPVRVVVFEGDNIIFQGECDERFVEWCREDN